MSKYKKRLGKIGEEYAENYLREKGFEILDKNVYIGGGEIDIVAKSGNLVVFIEVKTRENDKFVDLLDSLDQRKEEALSMSCDEYLVKNKIKYDFRIDLIGLIIKNGVVEKFEHMEGII